jgi:hypothetical protein
MVAIRRLGPGDAAALAMMNALFAREFDDEESYLSAPPGPDHVAALLAKGIDDISVQSSVSLQHLPYDVELEKNLPEHLQGKLAFAAQKVKDIVSAAKDGPSAKAVALMV